MELTPLGSGFGVEARGAAIADIAENGMLYARLRAAFEEHSLLDFRDQRITDEIQLAYSRRFRPPEITKTGTVGDPGPVRPYLHRWRPGDLVMWDDRATLHRGQAWPLAKPRDMVRTMISATEADGLARMRLAA